MSNALLKAAYPTHTQLCSPRETLEKLSLSMERRIAGSEVLSSDTLAKVAANCPLDGVLQFFDPDINGTLTNDHWKAYVINLLSENFSELLSFDEGEIDFNAFDSPEFLTGIESYTADLKASGFAKQALIIQELTDSCRKVTNLLITMRSYDLGPFHVLPIQYLADLTVALPVWYHGNSNSSWENDKQLRMVFELVGSKDFAWLQQIYSKWMPTLSEFDSSDDPLSRSTLKIMNDVCGDCDFSAIATPYHDLALRHWNDKRMQRGMVDPLFFGCVKNFPFVFLFARWSGSGILPGLPDMIHATIEHLRIHKDDLANVRRDTPWQYGGTDRELQKRRPGKGGIITNTVLPEFAERLISAYDNHTLFQQLRPVHP